jgi:outer membrane protein OmpA-like peptidoglycan-associated protein
MTQTVGVFVDDILFDYDSSVLRSEYNGKLDELGDLSGQEPGHLFSCWGLCRQPLTH